MDPFELPMWMTAISTIVVMVAVLVIWSYHLYAKRKMMRKHLEEHPERFDEM